MDDGDSATPDSEKPEGTDETQSGDDARLAHFIRLLSDDDPGSRWKAAEALGRIGSPDAVEDLIGALWDDDGNVRLKAAWALGRIGDMRAYAPLQRLYRMENDRTQEIIQEALDTIRSSLRSG